MLVEWIEKCPALNHRLHIHESCGNMKWTREHPIFFWQSIIDDLRWLFIKRNSKKRMARKNETKSNEYCHCQLCHSLSLFVSCSEHNKWCKHYICISNWDSTRLKLNVNTNCHVHRYRIMSEGSWHSWKIFAEKKTTGMKKTRSSKWIFFFSINAHEFLLSEQILKWNK